MAIAERIFAEKELLDNVKITETNSNLDTLTVSTDFVRNADKFFEIGQRIAGSNFGKVPYGVRRENDQFVTICPMWFSPEKANPLASWILFYLERALWIQNQAYVSQQLNPNFKSHQDPQQSFLSAKDYKNQPIYISPENKLISLR